MKELKLQLLLNGIFILGNIVSMFIVASLFVKLTLTANLLILGLAFYNSARKYGK